MKVDQGQIESARVNLAYCKITAPITGRVGLAAGRRREHRPCRRRQRPARHHADGSDQRDLHDLRRSAAGRAREGGGRTDARGGCLRPRGQDQAGARDRCRRSTTRSIRPPARSSCRATFENAKGTLFPNQFVNARLLVQEKHGVTLVPTAAVQRNAQATYVYVVKADSTVDRASDHHRHDGRRRLRSRVRAGAGRRRGHDRRRQTAGREQGQHVRAAVSLVDRQQVMNAPTSR